MWERKGGRTGRLRLICSFCRPVSNHWSVSEGNTEETKRDKLPTLKNSHPAAREAMQLI